MNNVKPKRAVFLDRDGTINVDSGYVFRIEDLKFEQNAIAGLRALHDAGYLLFIVTNQSGIARGFYTERDYEFFTAHLIAELDREGVKIEKSYACPFHPDGIVPGYQLDSSLRKPAPGMLEQADKEFFIDKAGSFMIGDKSADIEAGHRFGIRSILVRTGNGAASEQAAHRADFIAADLLEAAHFIISTE